MKIWIYDPRGTVVELQDGKIDVVAENIRSAEEGALISQAPQMQEHLRQLIWTYEWILESVNLFTLPPELQPIRGKLEKARADLRASQTPPAI